MSDDLVKRLEVFANGCRGSMWQSRDKTIDLMDEAAARIRELEAELAALREVRALTNELLTLLSRLGPIDQSHCRYHNKWYRVDDVVNDLRATLEPAPVTVGENDILRKLIAKLEQCESDVAPWALKWCDKLASALLEGATLEIVIEDLRALADAGEAGE